MLQKWPYRKKPEGLIKFRATQMSDNQHKIKTAKNYDDMFTIHIHTEIHITKHSYIITNTVICLLTKKIVFILQIL